MDKESILNSLLKEMSFLTKKEISKLNSQDSLGGNGLDSLTFVELLVFIKRSWDLDFMSKGLGSGDVASPEALAEKIFNELPK